MTTVYYKYQWKGTRFTFRATWTKWMMSTPHFITIPSKSAWTWAQLGQAYQCTTFSQTRRSLNALDWASPAPTQSHPGGARPRSPAVLDPALSKSRQWDWVGLMEEELGQVIQSVHIHTHCTRIGNALTPVPPALNIVTGCDWVECGRVESSPPTPHTC